MHDCHEAGKMMANHAMLARTAETPMPVHRSKAITMIVTLSFLALLSGAASAEELQDGATVTCDPGATARLTIVNQCADAIWTVIAAPGAPSQSAVREQWDWVNPYVTNENTIDTGGTGSIEAGPQPFSDFISRILVVGTQPNPLLGPGMKIKIIGAGSGGTDLTTKITSVSLIATLGAPGQAVTDAQISYVNKDDHTKILDPNGGTGSIAAGTPSILTVTLPSNLYQNAYKLINPPANASIKIIGAGVGGGDLVTTFDSTKVGVIAILEDKGTAVTGARLWFYDGLKAFKIKPGAKQDLCVPDKGAPSGNFRFFMGCPSLTNDTDPFNTTETGGSCIIGSSFGDAAGVNTLFEPSFGCIPPLKGSQCAFNASSEATNFPKCADDPNGANCGPLISTDFFDVSAVDGYTFAMRVDSVAPSGGLCDKAPPDFPGTHTSSKDASMLDLASCPTETVHTLFSSNADQQNLINTDKGISLLTQDARYLKSCAAPHKWFGSTALGEPMNSPSSTTVSSCTNGTCTSVSYYAAEGCDNATCPGTDGTCPACPAGSGPQQKVGPKGDGRFAIQNTNFVQQLRALGYTGYTWQYDDGVGTQTCDAGAQMTVTLCPTGSSPTPYLKNPLWTFSTETATCGTDGTSSGTRDGITTFGSLFECQSKSMLYTCTDLTDRDPFKLPIGIWAANRDFTLLARILEMILGPFLPEFALYPYGKTYDQVLNSQVLVCQATGNLTIPASPEFNPPGGKATLNLTNCTYYGGRRADNSVCPK